MKTVVILLHLSFLTFWSTQAQNVLLTGDTTIRIALDSTGYAELHPHDISDEAGLFIYSKDGREAIRIYGSFRLLSVYDSKKNFHPYDLTQPTIPTGANDFHYPNSIWTMNMSRLGVDALIGSHKLSDLLIRFELDWKGDNENFRIRHLFLRSEHWLIGKSWSSFNNVAYLVQAVDGRFAGGAVGTRPPQLRYYNKTKRWKYQFSFEYAKPSLIQPDSLGAEVVNLIPNFAANLNYESKFLNMMMAGVLRSNRVQYTINDKGSQTLPGYGGILAIILKLNKNNRLKSSASGGVGIGGLLGDFAFVPMDLAFNPINQEFESIMVYTAYVGLEHDWSNEFTSSIGWGITGTKEQTFFNDGFYKEGSKILINLFYRPTAKMKHLSVGAEVEYAERKNINSEPNNTTRASFLMYFDF